MSETVAVRREELEWLLREVASRDINDCDLCPMTTCRAYTVHACQARLRAHFLPEEARDE